jgi:hypothetical protein
MRSYVSAVAWNIIEAIYVIRVAPPPPEPSKTPIQSQGFDKPPGSNPTSSVSIQILATAITS